MQLTTAIQALSDAEVDFVVIGGVSANLLGSAQLTFDLDVCYDRRRENRRRIVAALAPYHPRPRNLPANLPFIWDEVALGNSTVLTLRTDLGPIDLLAEVAGLGDYSEVFHHAAQTEAFERRIYVLTLTGLVKSKRAAGREKDINALVELEQLLRADD